MARITVEDCLDNVENIFEMVLVAAKRARRIAHGADPMVELHRSLKRSNSRQPKSSCSQKRLTKYCPSAVFPSATKNPVPQSA